MLPANVVIVFMNETHSLLVISSHAASWHQPSDKSHAFITIAITQVAGRQAENDERILHERLVWHRFCLRFGMLFMRRVSMGSKLVFVGSEIYLSDEIKSILDEGGYEIESSESIEDATQKLDRTWSSVLLIDLDGKEITNRQIRDFRRRYKGVQIVAFSSRTYHPELKESLREDVCACLGKPLNSEELIYWLNSITEANPDLMITALKESSLNA